MAKPGRPKAKRCSHSGCGHEVAKDNRYCGLHSGQILAALRASREYITWDRAWHPDGNGGRAEVLTDW